MISSFEIMQTFSTDSQYQGENIYNRLIPLLSVPNGFYGTRSNLFCFLFDCCGHNLFQVFPGLLSFLVEHVGLALGLLQFVLNISYLLWRELAAIFLKELLRTAYDFI